MSLKQDMPLSACSYHHAYLLLPKERMTVHVRPAGFQHAHDCLQEWSQVVGEEERCLAAVL